MKYYLIQAYVTMCKLVGFNRSLHWSSLGLFIFVCFIQSICWARYFQRESPLLYLSLENFCFTFISI